jgi:hypothetical protein
MILSKDLESFLSDLKTVHEDPPFAPTPQETRQVLSEYRDAVLVRIQVPPSPDPTSDSARSSDVRLQDKAAEGRIRAGEKSLPQRLQKDGARRIKSSAGMRYALSPGFIFKACRIR